MAKKTALLKARVLVDIIFLGLHKIPVGSVVSGTQDQIKSLESNVDSNPAAVEYALSQPNCEQVDLTKIDKQSEPPSSAEEIAAAEAELKAAEEALEKAEEKDKEALIAAVDTAKAKLENLNG